MLWDRIGPPMLALRVVSVFMLALLVLTGCRDEAPERQLTAWRQIEASERLGARIEVPLLLDSARTCYDSALHLTAAENARWFVLRDYDQADSQFARAHALALRAADQAAEIRRAKSAALQLRIAEATARLDTLRTVSRDHLMRISLQRAVAAAELHLATATRVASESAWAETSAELDSAEEMLSRLDRTIAEHAEVSGRDMERWQRWVEETIAWSRRTDSAALIVVKRRHKAYLVTNGRVGADFTIELGYGSAGDKQFAGDAATPEGIYRITRSRPTGSRYYKALDLDYPNREDKQRFDAAVKSGAISLGNRIGGNIEIHGRGGRGGDWTNGCIAMTDEDIDRIMPHLKVGCRVTIVRALDGWPK